MWDAGPSTKVAILKIFALMEIQRSFFTVLVITFIWFLFGIDECVNENGKKPSFVSSKPGTNGIIDLPSINKSLPTNANRQLAGIPSGGDGPKTRYFFNLKSDPKFVKCNNLERFHV